ncbi:hypothetical protein JZU46_06615, partial [bacterium]|nr:hypothetical protein [bacterium]
MIRTSNLRFKDGETFDLGTKEETVEKAFESLILYEFGYGGKIDYVAPTRIACLTNIMGCIDTTFFSGPADEMKLLVEAATIHHNPKPCASSILGFMANMSEGIHTARSVLFKMVNPGNEAQYEKLKVMSTVDLLACVLLVRKDEMDIDEVLSL